MKRFISALLAIFTIVTLICVPVVANETPTTPSGTWIEHTTTTEFKVADTSKDGGTVENPYLIQSADDLAYLAKSVNTGNAYAGMYFKQTANIDLSAHYWIPIGNGQSGWAKFTGIYDGNNKEITGLNINQPTGTSADKIGLFGYVANGNTKAEFHNMTVKGSISYKCTTAAVNVKVGGIVGFGQHLILENCHTDVDITLETNTTGKDTNDNNYYTYVGGLVGHCGTASQGTLTVNNCVAEGDVHFTAKGNQFQVGGLVGYANGGSTTTPKTISNSYFTGNIVVDKWTSAGNAVTQSGNLVVGGIVGTFLNNKATINNCHMLGTVKVNNVTPTETAAAKCIALFVGYWGNPTTSNTALDLSITNSTCFVPTSDDFTFKDTYGYSRQAATPTIPTIALNEATTEAITLRALQRKTSAAGAASFDIRLLATMNSTSFDKAGYEITAINASGAKANATKKETTTVYEQITAGSTPYTAGDISKNADKYIVALGLKGIPTTGTVTVIVTPFVVSGETTSYGATTVILYEDGAFVGFFTPGETQVTE